VFNQQTFEFPIFYTSSLPKIALGWGVHEIIADECKAAGIKKALIVTSGLKGNGIINEVKGILNYGGSSIDTGKGLRVVAANGGKDVTNFIALIDPPWMETLAKLDSCTIPQISVATTAGTGAEVTSRAALSNTKTRAKVLVGAPNIHSTMAIIDPLLVRLMPKISRLLSRITGPPRRT